MTCARAADRPVRRVATPVRLRMRVGTPRHARRTAVIGQLIRTFVLFNYLLTRDDVVCVTCRR